MGYKLAGYTVLGNCEIDLEMMKLYRRNHHPKYPYLMDIREFNQLQVYPEELRHLESWTGRRPAPYSPLPGTGRRHGERKRHSGKDRRNSGWMICSCISSGQQRF